MTARNYPARTRAEDTEHTMTTGTISHTIEDNGPPGWRDYLADAVGARLHAVDTPTGRTITNVIKRTRPRRQPQPGAGLVSAGMVLLGLLDAGLLYVVFDAQDRFIFSVKHQGPAAMIQALALDLAMIIFSVLGLGLARRGLAANAERACIVVCALASAFMNWTASNPASLRSVAVYVSAPVLLALTTDRTISVVRRHVLGMREDGSVWGRLGHAVALAALYTLRLVVDFTATRQGLRQAILDATPLPGQGTLAVEPVPTSPEWGAMRATLENLAGRLEAEERNTTAVLASFRERVEAVEGKVPDALQHLHGRVAEVSEALVALADRLPEPEYPTKKAALLAAYRKHPDHGRRDAASRVAAELADAAGLQPGTARSYIYAELAERDKTRVEAAASGTVDGELEPTPVREPEGWGVAQ